MTTHEAAYLAGILDGEGCITVKQDLTKSKPYYYAFVEIVNTDKALIDWLCERMEIKLYIKEANRAKNHRKCWFARFTNKTMQEVLPQVLPFMVIKKRQVELLIQFLELHLADRWNPEARNLKVPTYEFIAGQFKTLNTRGYVDGVRL